MNRITRGLPGLASPISILVLASMIPLPAHALLITPTFVGTFTAQEQATINSAIAQFESTFSDPITVNINFTSNPTGLGSSSTFITQRTYSQVHAALIADAKTADDATAVGTLGVSDPFATTMWLTFADCRALGLSGCAVATDGTININTTLTDADRSDGITAGEFDMRSVVMHEIDEVLGSPSGLNLPLNFPRLLFPQDLFRYTAAGARTFTTSGNDAHLSIDGGTTFLARFNQQSFADFGDFFSCAPDVSAVHHVQDACGTPGVQIDYSNIEATMMDVIGYDRIFTTVPEPASLGLLGIGFAGLGFSRRRKAT